MVRHGKDVQVEFTTDWSVDAQHRDLTINSLSMDEDGVVYDYSGGVEDLKNHVIRFNGEIRDRLCQNPIRILRYFRFDRMRFSRVNGQLKRSCRSSRFFSRLASENQSHSKEILDTIEECLAFLKGNWKIGFDFSSPEVMSDVPTQKIWIELKLILRSRLAGHVLRTMFEQGLASILGNDSNRSISFINRFPFGSSGLPNSLSEVFELENRWLRCVNEQPEPMTLLVTLFDDQTEVERRDLPSS